MEPLRYLDFELRISPLDRKGRYVVHVYRSPAGEAEGTFRVPFKPDKLENLILKLSGSSRGVRKIDSPETAAARELGAGLFQALFTGPVRDCLRSSLETARAKSAGLRLKLRMQEAPALVDLPWEFLFDADMGRFLAQSVQTPIVRYTELPESVLPLTVELPLRILGMVSSPSDYPALDVQRERTLLEAALSKLIKAGDVEITWLESATLKSFHRTLRNGPFHIFHFIGHGGFDKSSEQGVLVLLDENGRGLFADAERLGVLLHDHRSMRLAVLNACEGARNSRTDPFAGVATALIRQSIPAVVAMQFTITDPAAIAFSADFYAALAQGFPVDAAVSEARKAIYSLPNDVEWGTPVLYLRAADGVLFDVNRVSGKQPVRPAPADTIQDAKPLQQIEKPLPSAPVPDVQAPATQVETARDANAELNAEEKTTVSKPQPTGSSRTERLDEQPGPSLAATTSVPTTPRPGPPTQAEPVASGLIAEPRLLRTLKGHDEQINSIAFSPDGRLLASGAGGFWSEGHDPLRLWQVSDGKQILALEEHTKSAQSVAFSPDGRLLASGAGDSSWLRASGVGDYTVRLWQVADGKLLQTIQRHTSSVTSVAFSPDSRLLALGSNDKTVRLWQVAGGKLLQTLKGHTTNCVMSVAFSPDGRLLASGAEDKTVRLWQVADGKLLQTLQGHFDFVNSVAFSPDGRLLASGSKDKTINLWQLK